MPGQRKQAGRLRRLVSRSLARAERDLRPGLRSLVGFLLIVAGSFGFLPLLGFWMIPLGVALIGLDLKGLHLRWKARARRPGKSKKSD